MVSRSISHYRILSKLGQGGMGEVYLAEDTRLDRRVALKILPQDFATDAERMRRFVQEAKAASALNHPNILTIHEVGKTEDSHYIATEFIEGETLRHHIQHSRMKLGQVLDAAVQVASALAAAHSAGIIHRDIKPENLMLRPDGYVKVLDFGLAKLTEKQPVTMDSDAATISRKATDPGTVMGTVQYMSPEQARGKDVDARSDIFSLGIVLYEMVAGRTPFAGESSTDVMAAILHKEPPPLARFAGEVPAELQRIVGKCLRKERDERYQTMKDLLLDLKELRDALALQAKLERSIKPATSKIDHQQTSVVEAEVTKSRGAKATSSAEYLVSEIKQHKRGIAVALLMVLLAAIGLGYWLFFPGSPGVKQIESIAVMPFVNESGNADVEYLSDGMTETLINSLSQLPALRVIARSSVFRYKGKETDPMAAGKELGVRAVLTGRVLQHGDDLTISVELNDVRENKQVWGERYERKAADLLSVQREMANEISANLRLKLSGAEQNRVTKRYTENPEAYQLYLKGRFHWNKRTGEALKKSIEYFNQAIEKDPGYALAFAGMADAYVLLPGYSAASPQDAYPKAKAAAERALALDETLAEAHTALADVFLNYDWSFPEARREFQRAIELNPNYATAHQWYGSHYLWAVGRFDEAIAEGKRAQELDPLSLIINTDLGSSYFYARQYDQAIEQLRRTIEMDQSFYYAHMCLGIAYEMKGALPEALAEYKRAQQLNDDPYVLGYLVHLYAVSGKRDEGLKTLGQMKEMAKQRYIPAFSFAIAYAALGEKNQAFEWLERGYQDRASDMLNLKIDPFLDNLRSDPRFVDLARRVGLS